MTKVKVISVGDLERFESVLNDFIKDKKVVDIKYQPVYISFAYDVTAFVGGTPVKGTIYNRAMVIYEE